MSDLHRLAEQAAAALGVQGEPAATPTLGEGWLRFATRDEVAVIAEAARAAQAAGLIVGGRVPAELIPVETLRRCALRSALDLYVPLQDELGRDVGRLRSCLVARGVRGCGCAEDAVREVEAAGGLVDARMVAVVRDRALELHARRSRRVARVQAWLRGRVVPAVAVLPVAVPGRPDPWANVVPGGDVIKVVESVPVGMPVVSRRRRSSSVASRQLPGSEDVLAKELARRLGVDYTTSSWRALPIVDSRPRDAS